MAPRDELCRCCGRLGRMAARVTPLRHSVFALEPQHGPSFSPSLLIQVHEAAAVVETAAAMLASSGDHRRAASGCCRVYLSSRETGHLHRGGSKARRAPAQPGGTTATPCRSPSAICERLLAPHSRPPRQSGAARSCTPGGARQGPVASHVLSKPRASVYLRSTASLSTHDQKYLRDFHLFFFY